MTKAHQSQFVQLLIAEQPTLERYIRVLLGDGTVACDILQQTNLVIWEKADQFELGTNFTAWTRRIAYWQIKSFYRDSGRDQHVFSEALMTQIAEHPQTNGRIEEEISALTQCLTNLRDDLRQLITQRYDRGLSIAELAKQTGKSQDSVKSTLMRIRRTLANCVTRRLQELGN